MMRSLLRDGGSVMANAAQDDIAAAQHLNGIKGGRVIALSRLVTEIFVEFGYHAIIFRFFCFQIAA
ncbi:hypothetical protein CEK28_03140 [Xenophilus sp. AP218F]|nr:hypothetical protein [Chromobacterium sp. ASV5]OWY40538.1 hypothetical protein CEK28_03140 [Xenophilus sp. AP218F]